MRITCANPLEAHFNLTVGVGSTKWVVELLAKNGLKQALLKHTRLLVEEDAAFLVQ